MRGREPRQRLPRGAPRSSRLVTRTHAGVTRGVSSSRGGAIGSLVSEAPSVRPTRGRVLLSGAEVVLPVAAVGVLFVVVVDALRDGGATLGIAIGVAALPVVFVCGLALVSGRLARTAPRARAAVFSLALALGALSLAYLVFAMSGASGARLARTLHELVASTTGDLPLLSGVLDRVATDGGAPSRLSPPVAPDDGTRASDAGVRTASPDAPAPRDAGASPARAVHVDGGAASGRAAGASGESQAATVLSAAVALVTDGGAAVVARVDVDARGAHTIAARGLRALGVTGAIPRAALTRDGAILVALPMQVVRVPIEGELDVDRAIALGRALDDGRTVARVLDAVPLASDARLYIVDVDGDPCTRAVVRHGETTTTVRVAPSPRALLIPRDTRTERFLVEEREPGENTGASKPAARLLAGRARVGSALEVVVDQGPLPPFDKAAVAFYDAALRDDGALLVDVVFAAPPGASWPLVVEAHGAPRALAPERVQGGAPWPLVGAAFASLSLSNKGHAIAIADDALLFGDAYRLEDAARLTPIAVDDAQGGELARPTTVRLSSDGAFALVLAERTTRPKRGIYVVDLTAKRARPILVEGDALSPHGHLQRVALEPAPPLLRGRPSSTAKTCAR